jgi:hypothetical protein
MLREARYVYLWTMGSRRTTISARLTEQEKIIEGALRVEVDDLKSSSILDLRY